VHRDLKPANVMVLDDPPGRDLIKVLDFGLAKTFGEESGESTVTRSGMVVGTPSYMSPEAARGAATDARSDLYSLGVMLAELGSGRLPFQADTPLQMMRRHLEEEPSIAGEVPPAMASVLRKALAKDPAARHASAALMRDALEAAGEASRSRAVVPQIKTDRAAPVSGLTDTAAALAATSASAAPSAGAAGAGDSATSAIDRADRRRFHAVGATLLLASAAGTVALGYPGVPPFAVREWLHRGGRAAYFVLALGLLGAAAIFASARWPRLRKASWWLAAAPGIVGCGGVLIGSLRSSSALAGLPPLRHFVILNLGMWEANVNRFLGCAVSTALALVLAALPGPPA